MFKMPFSAPYAIYHIVTLWDIVFLIFSMKNLRLRWIKPLDCYHGSDRPRTQVQPWVHRLLLATSPALLKSSVLKPCFWGCVFWGDGGLGSKQNLYFQDHTLFFQAQHDLFCLLAWKHMLYSSQMWIYRCYQKSVTGLVKWSHMHSILLM